VTLNNNKNWRALRKDGPLRTYGYDDARVCVCVCVCLCVCVCVCVCVLCVHVWERDCDSRCVCLLDAQHRRTLPLAYKTKKVLSYCLAVRIGFASVKIYICSFNPKSPDNQQMRRKGKYALNAPERKRDSCARNCRSTGSNRRTLRWHWKTWKLWCIFIRDSKRISNIRAWSLKIASLF
jgi:hypothetical protein